MQIESGGGSGQLAQVSKNGQLLTLSESRSIQYIVSRMDGQAYQILSNYGSVTNTTNNILFLKNLSPTRYLILTYIRVQALDLTGGTAFPSANTYFSIHKNPTYSSGGDSLSPINMNFGSANLGDVDARENGFLTSDSGDEFDRVYLQSEGDITTFNKEGSVVLAQNDSIMVSFTTDHTAGNAYTRISFLMPGVTG